MSETHRRSEATTKSLVGFRVGGVHYAADIMRVREIVNPLPLVAVPHSPSFVLGVADHRGNVVPVVDLRRRFGLPEAERRQTKWILAEAHGRDIGLAVDEVTQVLAPSAEGVRPPPDLARGPAGDFVRGVLSFHGELVFLLDLDRLSGIEEVLGSLQAGADAAGLPPGRRD